MRVTRMRLESDESHATTQPILRLSTENVQKLAQPSGNSNFVRPDEDFQMRTKCFLPFNLKPPNNLQRLFENRTLFKNQKSPAFKQFCISTLERNVQNLGRELEDEGTRNWKL